MNLLHELILDAANRDPGAVALRYRGAPTDYATLHAQVFSVSGGLIENGLARGDRVAVYLPKQPEAVVSFFAATMAGGVFVPINPQLKPAQVAHVLRDCDARYLVTTADRARSLEAVLQQCGNIRAVVLANDETGDDDPPNAVYWNELLQSSGGECRSIDTDLAALLYTSGSTGKPKGVMLSHRNLVCGATSVSAYLRNESDDKLLTVLPFSFDYGLSQLTTAFYAGAAVVLFDYLLPRDVIRAVEKERITGLACVPPVWLQLARLQWPATVTRHLRYISNSGGALPQHAIDGLRSALPHTRIYLMYGLTEAFRSTFLEPDQLDHRPGSIGKAIPNAEVMVVRPDGSLCGPNEPGELVHRGSLVAMGYWNDAAKTAERFRPSPIQPPGSTLAEIAVWSGDTVRADEDGFLYFVGRRDQMIKTSGYRVSPAEIEEVLYASGRVSVAVAIGVPHAELGQAIVVVAVPAADGDDGDSEGVLRHCRTQMANYMIPAHIAWRAELPRTANDKIDRPRLAAEFNDLFTGMTT